MGCRSRIARLLGAASLAAALVGATASAQATLTSDQEDYAPGTTATLTGAGFAANESVSVQVLHADGTPDSGDDHAPWTVSADESGGFVTSWHVCEDDCIGSVLEATAVGDSGARASVQFTDAGGTGVVTVTGVGGSCVAGTPPNGGGPFNWEVAQGGTYTMTITGVTECTGNTITVFVQSSSTGNFCFNATGGGGTYSGNFTMPNPACNTYPVSYKCGANAGCNNADTFAAKGPGGANTVHLRASTFNGSCGNPTPDTNCQPDCCTPAISCPADANLDCSLPNDPGNTGTATVTNGCAATVSYRDSISYGSCPGNYMITRTWTATATDSCHNTATCSQRIVVTDSTPPTIHCPADANLDCGDDSSPASTGTATAEDDCSGATVGYTDSVSQPDRACASRTITRTWTATDDCGNSRSCDQIIRVTDNTPPTLHCPADAHLGCGDDSSPASTGTATAEDDCSGATVGYTDSVSQPDAACASLTITRTWTATDGCGNSASCDQTITVTDDTAPVITCPGDTSIDCAADSSPASTGTATATDDCSGATVRYTDSVSQPDPACASLTITRRWTATDGCGNSAGCDQTITVTDTTDPVITCPAAVTASGDGACCVAVDIGTATASDDCSDVTITSDAPAEFCVGDTTVTWTATDGCGNAATCTQTVTVLGQVCATKYYDANANGVKDATEVGVEGWQIVVDAGSASPQVGYTGADGTVCFDVPAGDHTVSESSALEANWVHTTATSCTVTIDAASCASSCAFGNYCFRAPSGGLTIGFWGNKNGERILSQPQNLGWKTMLCALNLKNANGTDFNPANYAALKTWLQGANATNMAYMLSAQLAANVLDEAYNNLSGSTAVVVPGGVKTGSGVCMVPFLSTPKAISCGAPPLLTLTGVPGSTSCGCSSNDGLVTIDDLQARADCLLGAYSNTTGASTQRTYQECVKNILDMLNNNGNNGYPCGGVSQFVNPDDSSCPATF